MEDLLMEYNCSLVNLRPFFTISAYTCLPSNMGNHMPSSALALNILAVNTSNTNIFFIILIYAANLCNFPLVCGKNLRVVI